MEQSRLERLKLILEAEGFTAAEQAYTNPDTYEVNASESGLNELVVHVYLTQEDKELPELLKPYLPTSNYEIERMIDKGNTFKRTWNGACFEIALKNYAYSLLEQEPEVIAMEARLRDQKTLPTLEEYREVRQRYWNAIQLRDDIRELEEQLEELY